MSAQAGIYHLDGQPVDQGIFARMAGAIAQHGPDGGDSYVSGSIGMVYRAFHTTPESHLECQPYLSPNGCVMTWDGRIDNRDQLIDELGDDLRSVRADVAIAAASFDRWGTDCFRKLVGDWALSAWNPMNQTLVLARDYIGIRHLYYYSTDSNVIWSTILQTLLLLPGVNFSLNEDYIAGYLALWPEAHLTPYREICAVPPGQFMRFQGKKITIQSYWACDATKRIRYKNDAQYEEHFRQVFRQAVRRRLRSNSPVLAELSGGLDSSSIVCVADDIVAREETQSSSVDTISYYDQKERTGDDFPYFTLLEQSRGKTGHHIDAGKYRPSFSLQSQEFFATPGSLGGREGLEAERRQIMQTGGYRVLLSGTGGDEFLGGIPDPRPQLADLILQLQFSRLAHQLMAWSLAKKRPWIQLLLESFSLLMPQNLRALVEKQVKVEHWICSDFARRCNIAARRLGPSNTPGFWLPSRRDIARTLVVLSWQMGYTQPPAAAFGERRYPYLDQDFVEFIVAIPASQLLRPGERRSLMRRALRAILPPEILKRKSKNIWSGSYMLSLCEHWQQTARLFERPLSMRFGILKGDSFLNTLVAAKNGDACNITRVLRVIALELWLTNIVENELLMLPTARIA